ncbi:unnamed protein product [Paramecium primaurelia]|uniref:STAS domain-containing protein n=1 Tax=Paramecium primaurelia TaxID=5886 RepID=A0A8S1KGN8_PARPR|nr:unnamed protein product [Paramecium primaurelia]
MNKTPLLIEMAQIKEEESHKISGVRQSKFSIVSRLSVQDLQSAWYYIQETWKSGMSQAALNMPFVLALGANSGVSAAMGLTTAFIAAFVNGFFSGSNHSIYMPSWTITGWNYVLTQQYGIQILPLATFVSGLMIYLISLFKWHQLSDYIPQYVIEGFYLGSGFLFLILYSDYIFGITDNHTNVGQKLYSNLIEMYISYYERGDLYNVLYTFLIFMFLQFGYKFHRPFPWVLLTTSFGLLIGNLYPTEQCLRYVYGNTRLQFNFLQINELNLGFESILEIIQLCIPIAICVTIQNLLCARGAQSLTEVKCDYDQETFCVSFANVISGLVGGIPCCASSRMYTLNIRLRDINKWSSIINACSIFIFYGIASQFFMNIPLYVIAGQILLVVYQFPPWNYLIKLYQTKRRLTLFKCILISWICYNYGVMYSTIIGCLHSLFLFAQKMSGAASEIIVNTDHDHRRSSYIEKEQHFEDDLPKVDGSYTLYRFSGSINYININNHINQIKQLAFTDYIIFSFRYVSVFDEQAIDKLAIMIENLMKSQHEIYLTGLHKTMIEEMEYNSFFKEFFILCHDKVKTLGQ